jgi:hydroxymethylpyrimidine pyrophosphatase-like HAD family hydrolase
LFLNNLPCDCIANYNGAMIYAEGNMIAQNNIPYSEGITFIKQVYQAIPNINISCYCEPYCFRENKIFDTISNEILFWDIGL